MERGKLMQILYSNILPLGVLDEQQTIVDFFIEQLGKADRVDIAAGYVFHLLLDELEQLVNDHDIKHIFPQNWYVLYKRYARGFLPY
jgi:hypothetical protein